MGPSLGKLMRPSRSDGELVARRFVAVELDLDRVAGAHRVVGRDLDIRDRREGARLTLEQVVAERFQRLLTGRQQAQQGDPHRIVLKGGIGSQALGGLRGREPGQRDRRQARQLDRPELGQLIGIAVQDALAELLGLVLLEIGLRQVDRPATGVRKIRVRPVGIHALQPAGDLRRLRVQQQRLRDV